MLCKFCSKIYTQREDGICIECTKLNAKQLLKEKVENKRFWDNWDNAKWALNNQDYIQSLRLKTCAKLGI